MKRLYFSVVLGLAALGLCAENPLGMPEYRQSLKLEFRTPEEARKAELKKMELPNGKKIAFSTRWDDTNNRHLKMAQTLAGRGFKGNFYLHHFHDRWVNRSVPEEILKLGSALGSHTVDHPDLPSLLPSGIFSQILDLRIQEESAYNTCVTAFVLPYCSYSTRFQDHVPVLIGDVLKRSGHFGGPEPWGDVAKRFGLAPDFWYGSFLFGINDRDPSPEQFEKHLARGLKTIAGEQWKTGPHLTLGLHTWQSDEGFRVLDGIFQKHAGKPDWWYCNENEYLAYRYQFFHTGIRKTGVEGKTALFELTRIAAPELGHNIPLTVKLEGSPVVSAFLDSAPLRIGEGMLLALPQDPKYRVPQEVELVRFEGASPGAKKLSKFPGTVQMTFREKENTLDFSFVPAEEGKMENVSLILRQPPAWKSGVKRLLIPELKGMISASFPLGERDSRAEFQVGDYDFYLQVDLVSGGVPRRLHAVMKVKRDSSLPGSPRDNALTVGPLPVGTLTQEFLAKFSNPSVKLADPGTQPLERWRPVVPVRSQAAPALNPLSPDRDWNRDAAEFRKKQEGEFAFAMDFETPVAKEYNLLLNLWNAKQISAIFINGKKYDFKRPCRFRASAGRNRVVLVYPVAKNRAPSTQMASVGEGMDLFEHVKFVPVER